MYHHSLTRFAITLPIDSSYSYYLLDMLPNITSWTPVTFWPFWMSCVVYNAKCPCRSATLRACEPKKQCTKLLPRRSILTQVPAKMVYHAKSNAAREVLCCWQVYGRLALAAYTAEQAKPDATPSLLNFCGLGRWHESRCVKEYLGFVRNVTAWSFDLCIAESLKFTQWSDLLNILNCLNCICNFG